MEIDAPIGPSPWTWRGREFRTSDDVFSVKQFSERDKIHGASKLVDSAGRVRLLFGFQCYAWFRSDGEILFWWEQRDNETPRIEFRSTNLRALEVISDPVVSARRMQKEKVQVLGLNSTHEFSQSLMPPGSEIRIEVPDAWKIYDETLVLADMMDGSNFFDKMSRAIYSFDWKTKKVRVIPQDWFNRGSYDFGYQWIARVARTEEGKIIGEGVRLGTFELSEDGRSVARWLTTNPFHRVT